jgi:hypothetical protein
MKRAGRAPGRPKPARALPTGEWPLRAAAEGLL